MPRAARLFELSVTILSLLAGILLGPGESSARIQWDRALLGCEPPAVFYSSRHVPGTRPCCPSVAGVCAGGVTCPPSGVCAGGGACTPGAPATRPNMVLMISDDQGACQFGSAQECRSAVSGTAIPAPSTPNLDLLAGYGTVFPVAHNTSSWCFPSLFSIVTGRYQRSMEGVAKPADTFGSIARTLRRLDGTPTDPYDARNGVGGYCTFLSGKLTDRLGDPEFHAYARTGNRAIGRTQCIAGDPGQPPRCGSEAQSTYEPTKIFRGSDIFEFLDTLLYRVPEVEPATFTSLPFFVWYAPRIPHQPLRSPNVIRQYLFGGGPTYPLGGLFDLGAFCSGASCPAGVRAFDEASFGDVHELDGNLWWMDDSVREIRKYLAMQSAPHCITNGGKSRFDVATPEACNGTWAETVTPDLSRNTIFMFLSDNGWHLPDSKHSFTENGTRTRMIVFDPRTLPRVPSWNPQAEVTPPPQESPALAHSVDIFATTVGFALDSPGPEPCPQAADGSGRCDGRDLRAHLVTAPGGPAAPETLRHAMCGHQTQRTTSPTKNRYLITRPGSVGRCTDLGAAACTADATCGANGFCLGGHCAPRAEPACTTSSTCPSGAVCLAGQCRAAPACLEDGDCASLFPGRNTACVAKDRKWCRNSPGTACSAHADCPPCAPGEPACSRLCEARQLKFYVIAGARDLQMTDLFLDPDENGLHKGDRRSLTYELSRLTGPYGSAMRRANCCMDDWWPEAGNLGTACTAGYACPADLTCNQ